MMFLIDQRGGGKESREYQLTRLQKDGNIKTAIEAIENGIVIF